MHQNRIKSDWNDILLPRVSFKSHILSLFSFTVFLSCSPLVGEKTSVQENLFTPENSASMQFHTVVLSHFMTVMVWKATSIGAIGRLVLLCDTLKACSDPDNYVEVPKSMLAESILKFLTVYSKKATWCTKSNSDKLSVDNNWTKYIRSNYVKLNPKYTLTQFTQIYE